jgi:hypothetical protein
MATRTTTLERFQAGMAESTSADTGDAQQQSLFLVPDDAAFDGKLYRAAPELETIGKNLIEQHGFFEDVADCDVRYFWRRKTGVTKGRVKIGLLKRASDLLGHYSGADYILWLSATTARDGKFTDRQVEAAVFHQLCHLSTDDNGDYIKVGHDFEGFARELTQYGPWTTELAAGGRAFLTAHQLGMFDADGDDDDEDEDDD